MSNRFARFGNDLHSGRRSYPFVQKRGLWLGIALALVVLSVLVPVVKGGFNLGIDFTGGSEFTVSDVANTDVALGERAVASTSGADEATVTNIAPGTVRVQTQQLDDDQTLALKKELQSAYGVGEDRVTSTFVGPTWGQGVTQQALWGLLVFVALALVLMALYFRTWKMSVSAIAAMLFTIVVTAGVYSLVDFEITPSAVIGFLTVLSYSLYDSVVVFDKVRENTAGLVDGTAPAERKKRTYAEQVNLAVNQTLVRSINTSVVGILPVGSILFIGAYLLGAGTLKDLSLSLFVGIIVGTLATLFVAAPLYSVLRDREAAVREQSREVLARRTTDAPPVSADPVSA
ncbi:protein translocase subunit SecF [Kocuria tytonicola]|uniref:Protein-export membrane protein SecF n=1 Tax=Kocuria tytonicola TaxID=2055946 RepID=A0A3L9LV20_9MICC|nr:protein translocase subunit SecF [Kocuria tytonicola]RLY95016.1 protein translocase subunit SecF [Kocuria tytonicola]RLZ02639.1 protein translocase subunit SecF [Kocuria tytonicola]